MKCDCRAVYYLAENRHFDIVAGCVGIWADLMGPFPAGQWAVLRIKVFQIGNQIDFQGKNQRHCHWGQCRPER